eukprot:14749746-Alexandrium_andersonii.AAC.1
MDCSASLRLRRRRSLIRCSLGVICNGSARPPLALSPMAGYAVVQDRLRRTLATFPGVRGLAAHRPE